MIPDQGWNAAIKNTNQAVQDRLLPVPFVGVYKDATAKGKPTQLTTIVSGSVLAELQVLGRFFYVRIRKTGAYGMGVVDRIE